MKILFAGPSLHGASPADERGIRRRAPAAQGDLQSAVLEGATVIGLVDGLYESIAAVWHKEILFALSQGVHVLGAASLGALRAAECHGFGMVPIGEVARRYIEGTLDDDAAVAQLHAPAELGFQPVTEALVDCAPAIAALEAAGLVDAGEAARLIASAERLFFKDRTWSAVLRGAGIGGARAQEALRRLKDRRTSVKRQDALRLVAAMAAMPDERADPRPAFAVSPTQAWQRTMDASRDALATLPGGIVTFL
ncbi:TfuA-like protein [Aureimonas sp. Leaf427]|uniref:TfuA-like protein n=1 Tax=Aureimonas sp. Leaf427 TaxID=1736375 RepID=UPI0009E7ED21|nr:TfuA-like protein [Aureimonas sp. Leaf427]